MQCSSVFIKWNMVTVVPKFRTFIAYIFLSKFAKVSSLTKDFLKMEFAFKYGIMEFPIHDLIHETQLVAAIGYGTDLNFLCIRNQLHI